jgi:hypothetical protein
MLAKKQIKCLFAKSFLPDHQERWVDDNTAFRFVVLQPNKTGERGADAFHGLVSCHVGKKLSNKE